MKGAIGVDDPRTSALAAYQHLKPPTSVTPLSDDAGPWGKTTSSEPGEGVSGLPDLSRKSLVVYVYRFACGREKEIR